MSDNFHCEVFPKRSLGPQEFKELGAAIVSWCDAEQELGIRALGGGRAVDDLLEGEPPQALAMRMSHSPEMTEQSHRIVEAAGGIENLSLEEELKLQYKEHPSSREKVHKIQTELGEAASSSGFPLAIGPRSIGRQRAIEGLRRHIPANLVEELRVDGISWDEEP